MSFKSFPSKCIGACFFMGAIYLPEATAQTTGTTVLSLTIPAAASITISTATSVLTAVSAITPYTGVTAFAFIVRTSQTTGSGTIQLKITSDFSPASGPSVGTPPTAGDALTYTCTATVGTACSGTQTASTTASTPVVTFGADAHSPVAGASGVVTWSLTNDAVYKSGTYTATATFTVSAT